ncbi:MAG TPA: hypothetical protein VNZ53_53315 [Steroidobacteraceae bacterium]|nr:hypothetical protein [Steroidobacteraceae bacterium]
MKLASGGAVTIIAHIINPLTIVGFVIYILATLCYIVALVAVLVHFLWNEPPGLPQITGLALIGSGVVLIHQH